MPRVRSILLVVCVVLSPLHARATASWSSAGSLLVPRSMHGIAALPDGHVIVFGGRGCQADDGNGPDVVNPTTEILDPSTGAWSGSAPLLVPVDRVVGITLSDGRVLAAGGQMTAGVCAARDHQGVPVSEIFANGSWSLQQMVSARVGHALTRLADGRVLASGGGPQTAEIFDPASEKWSSAGKLIWSRGDHSATLLTDGRVLIAGGTVGSNAWPSCEIWSPETQQWAAAATLNESRSGQSAVLLRDGRVLVIGGVTDGGDTTASTEIYDPIADTWTEAAPMKHARATFTSALLPDGRILAAGGFTIENRVFTQPTSSEIYDPATDSWSDTSPLAVGHENVLGAQLPDGRVVVAGGGYEGEHFTAKAEIFTP